MITLTPLGHAEAYNKAFPDRVPLSEKGGMVGGCWMIGAAFRNPSRMPDGSPFYGSYPHGYLERVHAMFPGARKILHIFSGGLTVEMAVEAAGFPTMQQSGMDFVLMENREMQLVDLGGEGRYPTTECSVEELPLDWDEKFDLVLADPPYSAADAEKYGPPMYNRKKVMDELHRVTKPGGSLVWLDTAWPMHQKAKWKTWATIGLVRSTQHRMRLVTFFERQA